MRDRYQPPGAVTTEVDDPAGVGRGELSIVHRTFPADADGEVEDGDVDPCGIYHLQTFARVVATGWAAVLVNEFRLASQENFGIVIDVSH